MSSFSGTPPIGYTTPPFPSLYWPIHASPSAPKYLYSLTAIWRYVTYWTLITTVLAHFLVALFAVGMQFLSAHQRAVYLRSAPGRALSAKNKKLFGEKPVGDTAAWVWVVPAVYLLMGGIEALLAGSVVGLVLGAEYNAGYFKMSTWTPLLWGIINMLVLVVSSFRVQGGL